MMGRKIGKKGVAEYLSWVLLISFAAAMSVFMYSWINGQVQTNTQDIQQRADTALCDNVGINIISVCQNTQTLNMNISNVKVLGISSLTFRFYDLYDNQDQRSINVTIRPGEKQDIQVIKQGTLKQAEIIPVTKQENTIITCAKSKLTIENIKIC